MPSYRTSPPVGIRFERGEWHTKYVVRNTCEGRRTFAIVRLRFETCPGEYRNWIEKC